MPNTDNTGLPFQISARASDGGGVLVRLVRGYTTQAFHLTDREALELIRDLTDALAAPKNGGKA